MKDRPATAVVRLGDGRRLAYTDDGARDGHPVLALHGTPGSHLKFAGRACDAATSLGLRLISLDRWGYGGSDAPDRPDLGLWCADIVELADRLGLDRFSVVAISGGGPFGAALLRLGARVDRIALVSPVGPIAGQADAGGGTFHRFCFVLMPRLPGVVRLTFCALAWGVRTVPDLAIRATGLRVRTADRVLLGDGAFRRDMARMFAAGLSGGVDGPVIDMAVFATRWIDDLPASRQTQYQAKAQAQAQAEVENPAADRALTKVRVWIGSDDTNVPVAAARRLAHALGASFELLPGQGHYWIAENWNTVLAWLQPRHGSRLHVTRAHH